MRRRPRSTNVIRGSIARGTPNSASSSSSQSSVARSTSSVREALVTSVTCTPAGQAPDQPAVDGAEGQLAALGPLARAGHVVEQPVDLGRREVRIEHQAGPFARPGPRAAAAQRGAALGGAPVLPDDGVAQSAPPVARSHSTVVSRWLVMPMAATSRAGHPGLPQRRLRARELRRPDLRRRRARPSPGCGKICRNSFCAVATDARRGRRRWHAS